MAWPWFPPEAPPFPPFVVPVEESIRFSKSPNVAFSRFWASSVLFFAFCALFINPLSPVRKAILIPC